jgi:transposase-like protein
MSTSDDGYGDRRRRRRHSDEFKARVVAACRKPGVSIAAVALDHRLNANLLRRWVVTAERGQVEASIPPPPVPTAIALPAHAAFVPVTVQPPPVPAPEIMIELRRGATVVKVSWPMAEVASCAAWLGELLR